MVKMSNKSAASNLETALTIAVERAVKLEADVRAEREQLEATLRLARGTGDVQMQAAAAVNNNEPTTLVDKIEASLRGPSAPLTFAALCRSVGASSGKVAACMRELRKANKVYNLGSEDHPRWIWILGDKTSTPELNAHVARLVSLHPLTFAQLLAATGARRGRVSGAIVQLQRNPETRKRLQNLSGDERSYVWFLPAK